MAFKLKNSPNAAFDTFDPNVNKFDPALANKWNGANGGSAGTQTVAAQMGQKMQVNLTLNNPTNQTLSFELFYYLNTCLRTINASYAVGNYLYVPLLSLEGLTLHAGANGGVIGFDQTGTLQIQGNPAAGDAAATIGCSEVSYAGFFEASAVLPFTVSFIRMTCMTDPQIDKTITYIKKSFSGGQITNPVSPRAYFKPTQFQSYTIDISVEFDIGIDTGLLTTLLAGENVRYALFIQIWTNQVLQ